MKELEEILQKLKASFSNNADAKQKEIYSGSLFFKALRESYDLEDCLIKYRAMNKEQEPKMTNAEKRNTDRVEKLLTSFSIFVNDTPTREDLVQVKKTMPPNDISINELVELNRLSRNHDGTYSVVKGLRDVLKYYQNHGQDYGPAYIKKWFRKKDGNPFPHSTITREIDNVRNNRVKNKQNDGHYED